MLMIEDLQVGFTSNGAGPVVTAVDSASLYLTQGKTLAVIGESGSGKSVMGLSICGLLPSAARISGRIVFGGQSLLDLPANRMRALRGRRIAFVPQSAGLSLNPTMVSGDQVAEMFTRRWGHTRRKAGELTRALLTHLSLKPGVYRAHPHRLSGGMRQRVLVSIGLASAPDLLIADEPTKGIDDSRRQEVVGLFADVRKRNPNMAILLITHDIHLAESIADDMAVMYAGRIMEQTRRAEFFQNPRHPYSQALLKALPEQGLTPIPGRSPHPSQRIGGCVFHPRCVMAQAACKTKVPPKIRQTHSLVRCWRYAHA